MREKVSHSYLAYSTQNSNRDIGNKKYKQFKVSFSYNKKGLSQLRGSPFLSVKNEAPFFEIEQG